ncbi:MAG: YidC/Oxa1 family membrane protein insertase [Oscillospiraceae bacterium]
MNIFSIISIPLGWVMKVIYELVGNYGVTLILFTLFTKVILLPVAIKQKKSSIKMNVFQPIIQDIQKKYANDKIKQQEELQRLQTDHGFSMTAGCWPALIQMPILFGLIDVIYKPLRYIVGISAPVIKEITPIAQGIVGELSKYSPESNIIAAIQKSPSAFASFIDAGTLSFVENFDLTFLSMNLTETPSLKVFNILLLIPVLSVITMVVQQYLMMKLSGQVMVGSAKYMPYISAVMFFYFAFMMPAGVSIYWIFSNVFGIIQELVLRIFFDPKKEKAKIEYEILEARKKLKEKQRSAPKKVVKKVDKYAEADNAYTPEEAETMKKRLERARQLDKEKYGE